MTFRIGDEINMFLEWIMNDRIFIFDRICNLLSSLVVLISMYEYMSSYHFVWL